jgi:hypothetical protein
VDVANGINANARWHTCRPAGHHGSAGDGIGGAAKNRAQHGLASSIVDRGGIGLRDASLPSWAGRSLPTALYYTRSCHSVNFGIKLKPSAQPLERAINFGIVATVCMTRVSALLVSQPPSVVNLAGPRCFGKSAVDIVACASRCVVRSIVDDRH